LLCIDYLSSKNGPLVASVPTNMPNLLDHTFSHSQKLPSVGNIVATPSVGICSKVDESFLRSGEIQQSKSKLDLHPNVNPDSYSKTMPLWTNLTTVEFATRWEALHSLGPGISTPKTLRVKHFFGSEYKCVLKTCSARMRLRTADEGWFAPAILETLHPHNHENCNWEMHYRETIDPTKTTKKPNAGLPPMIRALTDQFSLEPQLDPNEIFRKISICFRNDPLWMSASIRPCLKVQINQRTRYMRKRSPNQIKIEFTHDVIKFKETHQLILPPDHMPKPICSETHLAEVAKSYEARGFLRGRKSEEGVPHRDLIVLIFTVEVALIFTII
jgi:hypothetical protein